MIESGTETTETRNDRLISCIKLPKIYIHVENYAVISDFGCSVPDSAFRFLFFTETKLGINLFNVFHMPFALDWFSFSQNLH